MTKGFDIDRLNVAEGSLWEGPVLPLYVEGTPPANTDDDWWTGTLGDFLLDLPSADSTMAGRIIAVVSKLAGRALSGALSIVLLKRGTANAQMRWLSSTYRGTLAGTVEQFQFKMDWGNPGADPDLSEAGAMTLAEQLAGLWATAWGAGPSNWPSSVKFTEVGVVQKQESTATNKDGTGGDLSQDYGTAWFMYPSGTVVSGSSGAVALPFEVATAVTLQTDTRGPRGRGRLYLPPTHINSMGAAGLYTDDYVNACNTLINLYIEAVKAATPYKPIVVSRRAMQLHEIVSINCGHVPDSQRRRRRSQQEARLSVTLA
jgi:hypothetical protein